MHFVALARHTLNVKRLTPFCQLDCSSQHYLETDTHTHTELMYPRRVPSAAGHCLSLAEIAAHRQDGERMNGWLDGQMDEWGNGSDDVRLTVQSLPSCVCVCVIKAALSCQDTTTMSRTRTQRIGRNPWSVGQNSMKQHGWHSQLWPRLQLKGQRLIQSPASVTWCHHLTSKSNVGWRVQKKATSSPHAEMQPRQIQEHGSTSILT